MARGICPPGRLHLEASYWKHFFRGGRGQRRPRTEDREQKENDKEREETESGEEKLDEDAGTSPLLVDSQSEAAR